MHNEIWCLKDRAASGLSLAEPQGQIDWEISHSKEKNNCCFRQGNSWRTVWKVSAYSIRGKKLVEASTCQAFTTGFWSRGSLLAEDPGDEGILVDYDIHSNTEKQNKRLSCTGGSSESHTLSLSQNNCICKINSTQPPVFGGHNILTERASWSVFQHSQTQLMNPHVGQSLCLKFTDAPETWTLQLAASSELLSNEAPSIKLWQGWWTFGIHFYLLIAIHQRYSNQSKGEHSLKTINVNLHRGEATRSTQLDQFIKHECLWLQNSMAIHHVAVDVLVHTNQHTNIGIWRVVPTKWVKETIRTSRHTTLMPYHVVQDSFEGIFLIDEIKSWQTK